MLMKYKEKEFKSVSNSDLDLETEEEKKALEEKSADSKSMLETMTKALEGKVSAVKLSSRLKKHPVCLSSTGDLSMEMAKTLNAMPGADQKVEANVVLEINPNHPIYERLMALSTADEETLGKYSKLLYNQALLMEGMQIEDPVAFSDLICELMEKQTLSKENCPLVGECPNKRTVFYRGHGKTLFDWFFRKIFLFTLAFPEYSCYNIKV